MTEPETIQATDAEDWVCVCGNQPHTGGFYPYEGGRQVEPVIGGPWRGHLYACTGCNRVIDQCTLIVVDKPDNIVWLD